MTDRPCYAPVSIVVAALAILTAAPTPATPARAPGAVIQVLPQHAGWRQMSGGAVVEYWTTGSHGELEPASGALFVPSGQAPAGGWPIVAWDHGTTGLGRGCGGQTNSDAEPLGLARRMVASGIAVVAPDYLGLGRFDTGPHPYLETRTEAAATIDLVRAARAARHDLSRTWAVVGASQGGQAALATGHAAARYAPELDFRGTVALDPESNTEDILPLAGPSAPDVSPSDVLSSAAQLNQVPMHHPMVYISAFILAAVRAARPDLEVNSYLTPRGRAVLDHIGSLCTDDIASRVDSLTFADILARPLNDDRFRRGLDDYMTVPTTGYTAPILLLLNDCDMVVPSPLHAALVAALAANGVNYRSVIDHGQHVAVSQSMQTALNQFITQALGAKR